MPCLLIVRLLALAGALLTPAPAQELVGSAACRGCHPQIYKSYFATPMALSSGRVGSGTFRESFERNQANHAAKYRVGPDYTLEFTQAPDSRGARKLQYYVGSGAMGRSYLFSVDGFLFQSPVSYYSGPAHWAMSPGYSSDSRVFLSRPVEPRCLECHASSLQPIEGTQNGYRDPAFLSGGISCERCHGPGERHVEKMRAGLTQGPHEIVNPAKLPPARRDSICARCHLTGEARISRAGARSFQPGHLLSDSVAVFVWEGSEQPGTKVTSHFENLWQSACKRASGNRLWCGTCHDPHSVPSAVGRASYYREKCRSCHASTHAGARNHDHCISCHMPSRAAAGMSHVAFTDHSIPRVGRSQQPPNGERSLKSFWSTAVDPRDLGLAYSEVALRDNNERHFARALDLLQKAESQYTSDPKLLGQLAMLHDRLAEEDRAVVLYGKALQLDPSQTAAATNLGALYAKRGDLKGAIRLWQDALQRNPGLEQARINLAVAQAKSGETAAARATLEKALEFAPGHPFARKLLAQLGAR